MNRWLAFTTSVFLLGLAAIGPSFANGPGCGDGESGDAPKPNVIALNTNHLEAFPYDAGKVRFIAPSAETAGAYAVMELTEMPGYKSNNCAMRRPVTRRKALAPDRPDNTFLT
jgi:hypothetical protein